MRHLFVVDSLDKHIQNEKELIRPRRLLPAARATRARSAQFYVVLIRHDSTGVGGLFCICVESINLNLNLNFAKAPTEKCGRRPCRGDRGWWWVKKKELDPVSLVLIDNSDPLALTPLPTGTTKLSLSLPERRT